MPWFARKLRYAAHDGEAGASYIALIQLAKKKSGSGWVKFLLYRRIIQYNSPKESTVESICLKTETAEESIRRFWLFEEGGGKEFPGYRSKEWKQTTLWLNCVAAGGGYERFGYKHDNNGVQPGSWVRVGTPAPWSKRRRRKHPRFGDISYRLLEHPARLLELESEESKLWQELLCLEEFDEDRPNDDGFIPEENREMCIQVRRDIDKKQEEIELAETAIEAIKAEMRYKVHRMFPKPAGVIPKRLLRLKGTRSTWS